jgi:hypothetical protein
MNEKQNIIAEKILLVLKESNGHIRESDLLDKLESVDNSFNQLESTFVISRMIEDYKLIYRSKSWICLSSNGEVAINLGISNYIRKIHSNQRLDIKMKRLEVISKILSIIKDSHTILTIAVTAVCTSLIYTLSPNLKELLKLFLQWCKSIFFSS